MRELLFHHWLHGATQQEKNISQTFDWPSAVFGLRKRPSVISSRDAAIFHKT